MKKIAGLVFAMMMFGVILTGCNCQKACEPPPCYKGEG